MLFRDTYFCQYLQCNTVKSQMYMPAMQNCNTECAEVFAPLDSNISRDIQRVLTKGLCHACDNIRLRVNKRKLFFNLIVSFKENIRSGS